MIDAEETVTVPAGKITVLGVPIHSGSSAILVNTGSHANSSPVSWQNLLPRPPPRREHAALVLPPSDLRHHPWGTWLASVFKLFAVTHKRIL